MWQKTKRGLYKQFTFSDFKRAWLFVEQVVQILRSEELYPRLQNEGSVVDFWLPFGQDDADSDARRTFLLADQIDSLAEKYEVRKEEKPVDKITTKLTEVKLYADGGSRGNPGPSASGFVVMDMQGNSVYQEGVYLGITTNNQAEYQALKLGLEYVLHTFGARDVHVYMDSLLVINQMKKIFKVRNRDLWPVHEALQRLIPSFRKVTFDHVPRELNKLADAEVNKCLDVHASKTDS